MPTVVVTALAVHTPVRPSWDCRMCGKPWPCPQAMADLRAESWPYPSALKIYMSGQMFAALEDLSVSDVLRSAEIYERFLAWTNPWLR